VIILQLKQEDKRCILGKIKMSNHNCAAKDASVKRLFNNKDYIIEKKSKKLMKKILPSEEKTTKLAKK
jgi:hypothetical protein